jgi:hypothetical protein
VQSRPLAEARPSQGEVVVCFLRCQQRFPCAFERRTGVFLLCEISPRKVAKLG